MGETSVTEKVILKKKLTIFEYWRDRNIGIYMCLTFSHDVTLNFSWTKQRHLEKFSNEKLRAWILVNDGSLKNKADFASALDNVNNVKISDLLAYVVILLFSSICSHLKITCGGDVHFYKVVRLWKHPRGKFFYSNFKKSLTEVSFYFYLQLCKTILGGLLSYEVTLVRKCKKHCQNKWNKDF